MKLEIIDPDDRNQDCHDGRPPPPSDGRNTGFNFDGED